MNYVQSTSNLLDQDIHVLHAVLELIQVKEIILVQLVMPVAMDVLGLRLLV